MTSKRINKLRIETCPFCEEEFYAWNPRQKWCSQNCCQLAYLERRGGPTPWGRQVEAKANRLFHEHKPDITYDDARRIARELLARGLENAEKITIEVRQCRG